MRRLQTHASLVCTHLSGVRSSVQGRAPFRGLGWDKLVGCRRQVWECLFFGVRTLQYSLMPCLRVCGDAGRGLRAVTRRLEAWCLQRLTCHALAWLT